MLASVMSGTVLGVEGLLVRVEVDIAGGLPGFATVGLPENSVREARVRVQAAINNSGFVFPTGRITVNLAPADLRKEGTGFDLPIAVGIMIAAGFVDAAKLDGVCLLGELSLSGDIQPVRGVLAVAEMARQQGAKRMIVAMQNAGEAALVQGLEVRAAKSFEDLMGFLMETDREKAESKAPIAMASVDNLSADTELDLSDVRGQQGAKRSLEIAAAGGHNLLFVGGPGSGKTMMARRLAGILPKLSYGEALEVTRIHSTAGLTLGKGLIAERPFRAPHHSMTRAGLAGGGSGIPRPGEISLASHGVLFLDELPEFPRGVLEILRQPLESGEVLLSRANGSLRYPAKIMLVAAMNPCPCGHYGSKRKACRCTPQEISRYKGRLSGPLLDRIDLHIEVPPVEIEALHTHSTGESSSLVRKRVAKARAYQHVRLGEGVCNAVMTRAQLVETAMPTQGGKSLLAKASDRLGFSARAHDRIIRVARTIADLAGDVHVDVPHIAESIQYRGEDNMLLAA